MEQIFNLWIKFPVLCDDFAIDDILIFYPQRGETLWTNLWKSKRGQIVLNIFSKV